MKRFLLSLTFFLPIVLFPQQPVEEMKAVLSRIQSLTETSDDYFDSTYHIINQKIVKSSGAAKALWHGLFARFLTEYWQHNRYRISHRTPIADELPEDFQTWDAKTLKAQINYHFGKALEDRALLKKTPLAEYDSLLIKKPDLEGEGTLYDYIIRSYIDNLTSAISQERIIPERVFRNILIPNEEFVVFDYSSIIKNQTFLKLIQLHQEYTAYCLKEKPDYLTKTTLHRMEIIKKIATIIYFDEYLDALLLFEKERKNDKDCYKITFNIADLYETLANWTADDPARSQHINNALKWYKKMLRITFDSLYVEVANSAITDIKKKSITISIDDYLPANQPLLGHLNYKNCDTATIIIINAKTKGFAPQKEGSSEEWIRNCLKLDYFQQFNIALPSPYVYIEHYGDFIIPALPPGEYLILATYNFDRKNIGNEYIAKSLDAKLITVSNLQLIHHLSDDELLVYVTDRNTGIPISGAKVDLIFHNQYNTLLKKMVVFTDQNGQAISKFDFLTKSKFEITIEVLHGKDKVKYVVPSQTVTIALSDQNCKESDEYVSVEKHKQPQFQIIIDKPQECLKINHPFQITGKVEAFSGYTPNNTTINYTVENHISFISPSVQKINGEIFIQSSEGVLTTDQNGRFAIKIDSNNNIFPELIERIFYKLTASITDMTGETQTKSINFTVTHQSMDIIVNIPKQIDLNDSLKLKIKVFNENSVPQAATVHYTIYQVEIPKQFYTQIPSFSNSFKLSDSASLKQYFPFYDFDNQSYIETWREVGVSASGVFNTLSESEILPITVKDWREGCYKIKCELIDPFGDTIKKEVFFWGFKKEEIACHLYKSLWLYSDQEDIEKNGVLELVLGSYCKNTTVLIEVYNYEKIILSEWIRLNQSKEIIKIPLQGLPEGKIIVTCALAYENRIFYQEKEFNYNVDG